MRIERAGMEDVEAIIALERETANAPHWNDGAYRATVRGGDGSVRRCLLVARIGMDLAGFAVGSVVADAAELESLVVRASARRRGIGKGLCAALITWAWAQRAETVRLEVRAGSEGARALYGGIGFAVCGRRPAYYQDPVEDAVLMRLERASGRSAGL